MALLAAILLSFVPGLFYAWIVYWIDRFEKEPTWLLVAAFFWGAVIATMGTLIIAGVFEYSIYAFTGSVAATDFIGTALVAPLVEETLKGLAILLIFLLFRHEFDSILDGIVYAGIIALGFAATENLLYLYLQGYLTDGYEGLFALFVLRVILGAWGHPFYTAFIGLGFAVARLSRTPGIKLLAPLIGWGLAIATHALHNILVLLVAGNLGLGGLGAVLLIDWTGWALMGVIILWAILREQKWLAIYLRDEMQRGVITAEQYRIAKSTLLQSSARMRALLRGRLGETVRFYQLCAELAQKKHQLYHLHEQHAASRIERLRGQLAQLSPRIP